MSSYSILTDQNQRIGICCLPSSSAPPRVVKVALSILGVGLCIAGITIGAIWPSQLAHFGLAGRIGIIIGSYLLGTLLTEIGKDPIHSQRLAHSDKISKIQNTIEIATRIPRIVLSIILDIVLLIPYFLFLVFHRFTSNQVRVNEEISSNNNFIVLIHGTNSNSGVWEFGKHHLRDNPFGKVIAIDLEDNGSILFTSAHKIAHYAQRVMRQLPESNTNVVLIGHSMGGLVAAEVAGYLQNQNRIRVCHVFTIATPWQGAPLLDALPGCMKPERFVEMTEGSLALRRLNETVPFKLDAYGSTTDPLVPQGYSVMENGSNHRYPFGGHLALVALSMVWRNISAKLHEISQQLDNTDFSK